MVEGLDVWEYIIFDPIIVYTFLHNDIYVLLLKRF